MFVLFGPTLTTRARLLSTDVLVVGDLAADATGATAVKIAAHNLLRKDSSGVMAVEDEGLDEKLRIKGANGYISFLNTAGTVRRAYLGSFGADLYNWNDSNGSVIFGTNGIDRGRINNNGQWGIGGSPSKGRLHVFSDGTAASTDAIVISGGLSSSAFGQALSWYQNTLAVRSAYVACNTNSGGGKCELHFGTSPTIGATNASTRMILDGDGNLYLGRLTNIGSSRMSVERDGSAGAPCLSLNHTAASGTRYLAAMYSVGVEVGNITTNGTTTAYNTSSDRRLKNEIEDLGDSGELIDALRPRRWIWNTDGSPDAGFIADEFAEVFPGSVSGEKDGVQERPVVDPETGAAVLDADGEPVMETVPFYQSMQASSPEVMAAIIGELQSLRRRVAEAEATIAALTAASSNG